MYQSFLQDQDQYKEYADYQPQLSYYSHLNLIVCGGNNEKYINVRVCVCVCSTWNIGHYPMTPRTKFFILYGGSIWISLLSWLLLMTKYILFVYCFYHHESIECRLIRSHKENIGYLISFLRSQIISKSYIFATLWIINF